LVALLLVAVPVARVILRRLHERATGAGGAA
jgi:uncharacterized membrane protein YhaH (DUF805 family)